jgi:hypothetical protein
MSSAMASGKWVEVVVLALAGIGFAVWQLREVNREMARSRAERLAREAREAREATEDGKKIDAARAAANEEHPS